VEILTLKTKKASITNVLDLFKKQQVNTHPVIPEIKTRIKNQKTEATMEWEWKIRITDIIMIGAVFVGPIVAVLITLWSQSQKDKKTAKRQLFLNLMGERKTVPFPRFVVAQLEKNGRVTSTNNKFVICRRDPRYVLLPFPMIRILLQEHSEKLIGGTQECETSMRECEAICFKEDSARVSLMKSTLLPQQGMWSGIP